MKKLSFLLLFLITEIASAQCAMCKAVVESGNIEEAEGLNNGIVYLMVIPYLLVSAIIYAIYKYRKKSKL
ncbi:MAG TPA: hypothetical protein VJ970_05000 [Flavobacteriaceae bacterium]|nr:hypothetical protein [Flavobacteriaceae bacterium]